ncbi:MAG: motility associated factor glycosyltransferase family protein [Nitrospinales bacterium]
MTRERIQEVKSATLLRFNDLWRHNFLANQPRIQNNPGVRALKNKFKGVPGIVIGAGPSLDKNIRYLSQARGKAVIIAGDAALKPVLRHGIVPAFVVCLDPQEEIARFLAGVPHRGITLIAPSIVHPRVLDLWEGNVLFYHKYAPDIPILTEIQNHIPDIGVLTPGGSVLSVAYDLAFQLAANPIIFIGQDLSYPKNNLYSRNGENEEANLDAEFARQPENIVFETDLNGASLPTLKSMSVSRQWFNWAFTTWKREQPLEIVNCSEAGILTDHCKLMPLSEAIYKHCNRKINVDWTLKKALK